MEEVMFCVVNEVNFSVMEEVNFSNGQSQLQWWRRQTRLVEIQWAKRYEGGGGGQALGQIRSSNSKTLNVKGDK